MANQQIKVVRPFWFGGKQCFAGSVLDVPAGAAAELVGVLRSGAVCRVRLSREDELGIRMGVLAGQNDGFPNGRRLGDDVVDIALQVVAGHLVGGVYSCAPIGNSPRSLGDTVCANDKPFLATFPYLASPHDGVTRQH